LQAEDLETAEAFYTDVVGFHVKERQTFDDGRPLVILEERMGLTELPDGRAETGQAVEHVAFQVPDVEALVESLREHDVTIDDGPKPTSYGTSVYFFDPDGNRIECHD
jgi:catechol 2,3-dioxygenase-like lactoylglutathione lyase family enzyme